MTNRILFYEKQSFRQWWLWVILLIPITIFLFAAYSQIFKGEQFGNRPMSNQGLFIALGLTLAVGVLFTIMRLETVVTDEGICVRFFPFHLSYRQYTWNSLNRFYVRTYKPLSEYGGWGLRQGFSGQGKAYNVAGYHGLQLEFTDKKRLLIGTQKPQELQRILTKLQQPQLV